MVYRQEIAQRHQYEIEATEQQYKKELEELETKYSNEKDAILEKSKELEIKMSIRHQQEMNELYESLDHKCSKPAKLSKKYLDLKAQEQSLAKQQKYVEAMQIKKECDAIEKLEIEKYEKEKSEKIKLNTIKTANKHIAEISNLKKKIEVDLEELEKNKQNFLKMLVHKSKNRKSELEIRHKTENHIYDNKEKVKSGMFFPYN